MARILLVMAGEDYLSLEACVRCAVERASQPRRLSVGLVLRREPTPEENARMAQLPAPRFIVGEDSPWAAAPELWQGETWVMLGTPDMRFARGWDRQLEREADACQKRSSTGAVLTGSLPRTADALRAVFPLAADRFDGAGRLLLQRGQALRYAVASEPAAFISPDFCFAPAAFYREAAESGNQPFWTAFTGRWAVYTLAAPVIDRQGDVLLPPAEAPEDPEARARFARHFGVDFDARTLSAKAREGIWRPDLTAPTRVPLSVRMQEGFRVLDNIASRLTPLVVTAWMEDPEADPLDQELARFRRLCGMRNVPLCCYAEGRDFRQIAQVFPGTRPCKARYGLPGVSSVDPEQQGTYARLSRPFLLAAAREQDMRRSHYVWMDFGYLRYPVYDRAAVDWDVVCGDRITIARVPGEGGMPDDSMFCVPEAEVLPLCRDFERLCREARRNRDRLPPAEEVWAWLISTAPERFEVVDLPNPRELFGLTMPGRDEEWGGPR